MVIVPPGNKQIGDYSTVAVLSTEHKVLNISQLEGIAVVANTASVPVQPVKNILIGEQATVAILSANNAISCLQFEGIAVVQYAPPTKLITRQMEGIAVVSSNTTPPNSPVENLFIGEFSTTAVMSLETNMAAVSCLQLEGIAVVQKFIPRKELTTFNIEYAAEN